MKLLYFLLLFLYLEFRVAATSTIVTKTKPITADDLCNYYCTNLNKIIPGTIAACNDRSEPRLCPTLYFKSTNGLQETERTIKQYIDTVISHYGVNYLHARGQVELFGRLGYSMGHMIKICGSVSNRCQKLSTFHLTRAEWVELSPINFNLYPCAEVFKYESKVEVTLFKMYHNWSNGKNSSCKCDEIIGLHRIFKEIGVVRMSLMFYSIRYFNFFEPLCLWTDRQHFWSLQQLENIANSRSNDIQLEHVTRFLVHASSIAGKWKDDYLLRWDFMNILDIAAYFKQDGDPTEDFQFVADVMISFTANQIYRLFETINNRDFDKEFIPTIRRELILFGLHQPCRKNDYVDVYLYPMIDFFKVFYSRKK